MLPIGSISVAQRVVATLSQAGVSKIVMVTGCNATVLERHLAGNGIIFLRNDAYERTQMFDSVKIGLSYLLDKCDKVLFTPVDVPLFTAKTVKAILDSDAPLAVPMCGGKQGHPILIANELIPEILKDSGEMGLKGAMDRCSIPRHRVEVEDLGTIYDADTPEDFAALVEYHNAQLARPLVSVSLAKEKPFFDSQIAMLLMLVDETKSVRAAGQRMQLSYSSCWNIIRTLFRCMLGLLAPTAGSIHICGRDIRNMPPAELSHRAAYIPQSHAPVFNFSVFDMVLMGTTAQLPPFASPGKKQKEIAEAAMERMGIAHLRDRGCGNISGGERQLALIARAIAQQAKILVMDEPSASLDYGNKLRVMETVKSLTKLEESL